MAETEGLGIPGLEPGVILSGPENTVFDVIFDWIQNSIVSISSVVSSWSSWLYENIYRTITTWVTWLYDSLREWWYWIRDQVWSRIDWLAEWVSSTWGGVTSFLSELFSNLWTSLSAWFSQVYSWFTWLQDSIGTAVYNSGQAISSLVDLVYSRLSGQLSNSMEWLATTVTVRLDQVIEEVSGMIPEWILTPGKFVPELLDGVADWLTADVPGHSPRWTGIFESVFKFLGTWLFDFPKWFAEDVPERVAYGLGKSFKWVGDTLNPVLDIFNESIIAYAQAVGPMSPSQAVTNFSSVAKVGFSALAGLTGMTIAGELLHPLKRIGLGNLSAVIFDMTNYKMITGAFMGTMCYSMLQTPLRYYFNNLFRPMLIREGDFVELLSRQAFTSPETLQNPQLIKSMKALAPAGGDAFVEELIGYYGYRPEYVGLFKELSNTRLGYFALAGVARTGFYEDAWFKEALHRTGYSDTAVSALQKMMYELFVSAKLLPVMPQIRRLYREGFIPREEVQVALDKAIAQPTLADVRLVAMDLEQVYESKSMALDINLRAFSRGVISEGECRSNLKALDLPGDMISNHLYREKLGIIRRVSWTQPEAQAPFQFVEE